MSRVFFAAMGVLVLVLCAVGVSCKAQGTEATIELRILETTDLHTHVMDYDYYKDKATQKFGLARTASLIRRARAEVSNSVLVDNGDLIQGNPMGDYMAARGLEEGEVHPVYKAMNLLDYDVGNIGNHEFNYGLEFLQEAIDDARFPYMSANVIDAATKQPVFKPYVIIPYSFEDTQGRAHELAIGYIGFVPPQIMSWDKKNLEGRVEALDIVETAERLVPRMRAEGADLVIAIPHSGIATKAYEAMAENSVYYLSTVAGIDAIAFGHSHAVFPSKTYEGLPGADVEQGTINGVPSVMPGRWGDHLGVIDMRLTKQGDALVVAHAQTHVRPIFENEALVEADEEVSRAVAEEHAATRAFVGRPIGRASEDMYSFLALVQDDPTIQIVNMAQRDYVERFIEGDANFKGIPVLSAAAPFKAGGRANDPSNFTEVQAGELTFRNAADLYLYPNTLVALKVRGEHVRECLECSAGLFNRIDATSSETQHLINWEGFPTYNFDVIDGVEYEIDVSQAARYDRSCALVDAEARRIKNLTFKGKPVDDAQEFIIATNNYRAYGAAFAGTGEAFVAFSSPDENRSILAQYIRTVSEERGEISPRADNNWRFTPIKAAVALDLVFETSPSDRASSFIKEQSQYPVERVGTNEAGFAVYRIDLSAQE